MLISVEGRSPAKTSHIDLRSIAVVDGCLSANSAWSPNWVRVLAGVVWPDFQLSPG
jgi:hypothetical protein